MKTILKNNYIFIIIALLTLIYILFSCNATIKEMNNTKRKIENQISLCEKEDYDSDGMRDACKKILENRNDKIDMYTLLTDIVWFRIYYLNPGAFLIIIIPSLFGICNLFKNKAVINNCTRESYSDFIKRIYKTAYKYVWFMPVIALLILIICAMNSTTNPAFSILNNSAIWNTGIINSPILFGICYVFNIFLYSCTFINMSMIVARKQHNVIIAIILSTLLYIGIQLFLEVIVNIIICQKILNLQIGNLFNIMNIFTFSDSYGIENLLLFSSIIFILSIIGVFISFRNKEKFIVDCEKNN